METLGRAVPPYEYIGDENQAREFLTYLDKFPEFSFDTETTGLTPVWKHQPLYVSLSGGTRRACLPILLLPIYRPLFESTSKLKIAHMAKYDMHMIANSSMGIEVSGPVVDTYTLSVRENNTRPEHGLKFLAGDGLYERTDERYSIYPSFADIFGTEDQTYQLLKPENRAIVANYASMDAWATLEGFKELKKRLENISSPVGNLWKLFLAIEVPLTKVLYEYERVGFPIDVEALEKIRDPITRDMQQIVQDLSMMTGIPINPGSFKQISELVLQHLQYQPTKYTKGGKSGVRKPSVDEEVLIELKAKNDKNRPIFEKILQYRGLSKIKGTYVDGILKRLDPLGVLHTTYNQGGTETGRLSSSNPNVQNIPSRPDTYGIRKAFRALESRRLSGQLTAVIDVDFEQVEMKVMAALSMDETMIQIINEGKDIHSKTAALMYGLNYQLVQEARKAKARTKEQESMVNLRDSSKTIGFGIMFGETEMRLSRQLNCSTEEAKEKQLLWFAQFPHIQEHIKETHRFVQATGYITSLLGWRRYFPAGVLEPGESESDRRYDPDFWKSMRAAVNMEIQGTAAEAMKIVLLRLHKDERLISLGFVPRLTVHDEVAGTGPADAKDEILKRCLELATDPFDDFGITLPISITASGGYGDSWGSAK